MSHPSPTTAGSAPADASVNLDALYAPPTARIVQGVLPRLADFHRAYLAQATFFCLATGDAQGLDASPRGGPPGFVHVLDAQTLAFADWPGNNRIASLRNLQADSRMAMLFLFPGLDTFMRVNGHGRVSTDAELLQDLREGDKLPKTATIVRIDEVLYHCGRAIQRAGLWRSENHLAPDAVPSIGSILAATAQQRGEAAYTPDDVAQADQRYAMGIRSNLY